MTKKSKVQKNFCLPFPQIQLLLAFYPIHKCKWHYVIIFNVILAQGLWVSCSLRIPYLNCPTAQLSSSFPTPVLKFSCALQPRIPFALPCAYKSGSSVSQLEFRSLFYHLPAIVTFIEC